MIVQGHHTPEGRPHVDCGIEIPGLEVNGRVTFLVSTGTPSC